MARALCPTCGRTLTVRTDQRLPSHWRANRAQLSGEPRCDGSEASTKFWPDQQTESGPVRVKRTRR